MAYGYRATRIEFNFNLMGAITPFRFFLMSTVQNCPAYLFSARGDEPGFLYVDFYSLPLMSLIVSVTVDDSFIVFF